MLLNIFRENNIGPFQNTLYLEKNSTTLMFSYAFTVLYNNMKNTHKRWGMSEYSCFPKLHMLGCNLQCNGGVGLWEVIMA